MQIEVEGIPIEIHERGSGRPLLMVHGWSADHAYMVADLDPIVGGHNDWRRIYFDLPGHGSTPAPGWLGDQEQMLRIVTGIADAVIGAEPFAVAGNSYGGYLALGLVRTLPERLRGAALFVPDLPSAENTRDTPEAVTIQSDLSLFHDLAEDEQWIPAGLVVHEQRMLDEIRAHDMPGYLACDRTFLERLNAQYVHTGAAGRPGNPFTPPSLVVTGRQDATVGWRRQQELMPEFPRATFATLDLAGHHIGRIERPALFAALISDWLDRVERSLV
jgi:pimeloyl-ACP methyl ester carboxylesterase